MINRKKLCQGLSIIELVFGFTMSGVLLVLILNLLFSNQSTKLLVEDNAIIVNNANRAMQFMKDHILMAGYEGPTGLNSNIPAFHSGNCGTHSNCTFDGVGNMSDQIAVHYFPPSGLDCTNTSIPSGESTVDVFYIEANTLNNNINTLFCRGYNPTTGNPRSQAVAIAHGIDRLDILYGISNSGLHVDQYVLATDVINWNLVRSVRISILTRSANNHQIFDEETRFYNLSKAGLVSYNDRVMRYLFSTTVSLPNVSR